MLVPHFIKVYFDLARPSSVLKIVSVMKIQNKQSNTSMFYFSLNLDSKNYLYTMFQHTDSTGWTITPYCTATAKHPDFDLIDLGTYSSGNSFKEVGYTYSSGINLKKLDILTLLVIQFKKLDKLTLLVLYLKKLDDLPSNMDKKT